MALKGHVWRPEGGRAEVCFRRPAEARLSGRVLPVMPPHRTLVRRGIKVGTAWFAVHRRQDRRRRGSAESRRSGARSQQLLFLPMMILAMIFSRISGSAHLALLLVLIFSRRSGLPLAILIASSSFARATGSSQRACRAAEIFFRRVGLRSATINCFRFSGSAQRNLAAALRFPFGLLSSNLALPSAEKLSRQGVRPAGDLRGVADFRRLEILDGGQVNQDS